MQVIIVIAPARLNVVIDRQEMKKPERSMSVCSCNKLLIVNIKWNADANPIKIVKRQCIALPLFGNAIITHPYKNKARIACKEIIYGARKTTRFGRLTFTLALSLLTFNLEIDEPVSNPKRACVNQWQYK